MKESEKKNNQPEHSFVDSTLDFCRKNVKYISAGILFLLLILVMVQANSSKSPKQNGQVSKNTVAVSDEKEATEDRNESDKKEAKEDNDGFQKNAVPEVKELLETYYKACAESDEDTLKKCAKPLSTVEVSYRKVCGKYITSYQNIEVYTKPGLKDGDYIVSAYYEMKLKKVKTLAPGLDMFYVEKQKDGSYYLNNVYTQYNLQNKEYDIDPKYQKAINAFEKEPEVKKLIASVQKKYEDAVSSDEQLEKTITKTFQKAVAEWAAKKDNIKLKDVSEVGKQDKADSTKKDSEEKDAKKSDSKEKDTKKSDSEEKKADKKAPSQKKSDSDEKKKKSSTDAQKEPSDKKEETKKDSTNKESDKKESQKQTKKKKNENKVEKITPETVYATANVNVRKEPKEDADIYEQIAGGTQITRTGKTADGWSAVDYNGNTAYIKSDYLTTAAPAAQQTENSTPKALPEGKTIRLSQAIIVRKSMGEDKEKIGTAFAGENVTVIQSYAEGWTKINWNGVDGYAKTDVIK